MVVIHNVCIAVCYFNLEFGGSEGNIFVLMAAVVAIFLEFFHPREYCIHCRSTKKNLVVAVMFSS